jgi:hypothetical protein
MEEKNSGSAPKKNEKENKADDKTKGGKKDKEMELVY